MIRCKHCGRTPFEIEEYQEGADVEGITPVQYVKYEEPTYDPDKQSFLCVECRRG